MPERVEDQFLGVPQRGVSMCEKVHFEASPHAAEIIYKSVARAVVQGAVADDVVQDYPESGDEFSQQNDASKRLVAEFDTAFDLMVDVLVKQVTDVLIEETGKS